MASTIEQTVRPDEVATNWTLLYKALSPMNKGEFLDKAEMREFGPLGKTYSRKAIQMWVVKGTTPPLSFIEWATEALREMHAGIASLQTQNL